jgi:hypothetical protein
VSFGCERVRALSAFEMNLTMPVLVKRRSRNMKSLIALVSGLTIWGAVAVGCGSDSPAPTPPAATQCVGPYADQTQVQFTAGLATTGACISTADSNAVCQNDVTTFTGKCGVDCVSMGGTQEAIGACTLACIKDKTAPDPSDACLSCYITDVGCATSHCLSDCLADPKGQPCFMCRVANHCAQDFYACTGMPLPTGVSLGAGGTGGAGPAAAGSSGETSSGGAGGA